MGHYQPLELHAGLVVVWRLSADVAATGISAPLKGNIALDFYAGPKMITLATGRKKEAMADFQRRALQRWHEHQQRLRLPRRGERGGARIQGSGVAENPRVSALRTGTTAGPTSAWRKHNGRLRLRGRPTRRGGEAPIRSHSPAATRASGLRTTASWCRASRSTTRLGRASLRSLAGMTGRTRSARKRGKRAGAGQGNGSPCPARWSNSPARLLLCNRDLLRAVLLLAPFLHTLGRLLGGRLHHVGREFGPALEAALRALNQLRCFL